MTAGFAEFRLSTRDSEIVHSLVHRVRVFSVEQVARTWWSSSPHAVSDAKRRLQRLEENGLVIIYTALSHPEIPIFEPTAVWRPGDDPPHFGAISHQLKKRWKSPPQLTRFIAATRSAGLQYGSPAGRISRESEQTHDLHFSAVFLWYRHHRPEMVPFWKSESRILKDRERNNDKLPDAVIELPAGPKIVEFGGAYSKQKLQSFHMYCERTNQPYEVW